MEFRNFIWLFKFYVIYHIIIFKSTQDSSHTKSSIESVLRRSSRSEVFCKNVVLKSSQEITYVIVPFVIELKGFGGCFCLQFSPMNIAD